MRHKFYLLNRVVNSYDTTENKRRDEEISTRVEVFLSSTTVATKSNELDLASNKREREIKSVSSSQSSLSFFLSLLACDEEKNQANQLATKNPIEEKGS